MEKTMEVLKNLVEQGEYLSERFQKKMKNVNTLIEANLPYPSNYELILKCIKKHPNIMINNDNYHKKIEIFLLDLKIEAIIIEK